MFIVFQLLIAILIIRHNGGCLSVVHVRRVYPCGWNICDADEHGYDGKNESNGLWNGFDPCYSCCDNCVGLWDWPLTHSMKVDDSVDDGNHDYEVTFLRCEIED